MGVARGFTLVELLAALTVLAILVAIAFGGIRGAKERGHIARARGELAVLAQALELYRLHYGDFPQTGGLAQATPVVANDIAANQAQAAMFNALLGVFGPADFATLRNGPALVDLPRFRLEETRDYASRTSPNAYSLGVPSGTPPVKPRVASSFLDPWGNRYLYYYKAAPVAGRPATDRWQRSGYLLYSAGPDGQHTPPNINTGLFTGTTQTTGVNADNLYANP